MQYWFGYTAHHVQPSGVTFGNSEFYQKYDISFYMITYFSAIRYHVSAEGDR